MDFLFLLMAIVHLEELCSICFSHIALTIDYIIVNSSLIQV